MEGINRVNWRMMERVEDNLFLMVIIIVLGILLFIAFMIGRATALNHLKKYHLKEISDDVITELKAKSLMDDIIIEELREKKKLHMDVLSGMRHLLRKGE